MPSRGMYGTAATDGSTSPDVPDRISFGRPVLPPDVGAFHDEATASGSGLASYEDGSNPADRHRRPGSSKPTSRLGSASSTTAASSASGSREETGCGVAPSFQMAAQATKYSTPFGRPIVTRSSGRTPRSAYARASRLLRGSSPRGVIEPATSVTDSRSGSCAACQANARPIDITPICL